MTRNHIDRVHTHRGELVAIIISDWTAERGIEWFTEPQHTLQLGVMRHMPGKRIEAHVHNPVPRVVAQTVEVLFVKSGRLRADFYDADLHDLTSRELRAGDVCLLLAGGHGFEVLEECEIFEVKSGPYVGKDVDKTYAKS